MVGVARHLAQHVPGAVEQPLEDAVLGRLGQPPRRLGGEPGAQAGAVLGEEPVEGPQHDVEQVVVAAVLGHHPQGPARERRQRGGLDAAAGDVLEGPVHLVVPQQIRRRDRGIGRVPGEPGRVGRLGQPGRHPGHDRGAPHPLDQGVGRQEAGLDEGAEGVAELVLALHDDRRVGDGDAERVPEQGGDREPVGEAAHHAGLDRGLEVADPRGVAAPQLEAHERGGHDHQEAGGPPAAAAQQGAPQLLVGRLG